MRICESPRKVIVFPLYSSRRADEDHDSVEEEGQNEGKVDAQLMCLVSSLLTPSTLFLDEADSVAEEGVSGEGGNSQ